MAVYESNYIRLQSLAGDLSALRGEYRSVVAEDCDLLLKVIERTPYTTTFVLTYRLPGDPPEYPDMKIRAYHDAHLVEAQEGLSGGRAERELDQRWARNMMLNKWLEYCLERGHRFSTATETTAGR